MGQYSSTNRVMVMHVMMGNPADRQSVLDKYFLSTYLLNTYLLNT